MNLVLYVKKEEEEYMNFRKRKKIEGAKPKRNEQSRELLPCFVIGRS